MNVLERIKRVLREDTEPDTEPGYLEGVVIPIVAFWIWDKNAKRYRDLRNGRFLSARLAVLYSEQSMLTSYVASDTIVTFVVSGDITPSIWHEVFKAEIKDEYIRQYLAGIGGLSNMTSADWGSIGGMLTEQYKYLDGFAEAVAAGNLSQLQIANRANMYINSAREAFERALRRTAEKDGYDEENWVLGFVVTEHCATCESREGEGWKPIGYFPPPGDGSTDCLTNCNCHLEFRKSGTGEIFWQSTEIPN